MKKLAFFLSLLLIISSANSAYSATKTLQNTKCTDLHYFKVDSKIKFECIKKNGKLIWNSYKPLNNPNPKTFPWWNSMLQVRSFNQTPKTTQQVTYFPSPNVSDAEMQKFYSLFDDVTKYWSQFYVNPQPIIVTVITEKDHDWFINKWTELGKDDTGQGWWDRTGEGEGGAVGWNDQNQIHMYFKIISGKPSTVATRGYVFHEVTHFFQYTAIGRKIQNGPCWFDEGQADYVQAAQSAANSADAFPIALQSRYDERYLINKYFNFKPTADGLYKILSEEVSGSKLCIDETPYFGYTLGSLVSEKIVIDFGWRNYLALMDNLAKSDWNEAFYKTTGKSLDDWYKSNLVPYLLKILAEKD